MIEALVSLIVRLVFENPEEVLTYGTFFGVMVVIFGVLGLIASYLDWQETEW